MWPLVWWNPRESPRDSSEAQDGANIQFSVAVVLMEKDFLMEVDLHNLVKSWSI